MKTVLHQFGHVVSDRKDEHIFGVKRFWNFPAVNEVEKVVERSRVGVFDLDSTRLRLLHSGSKHLLEDGDSGNEDRLVGSDFAAVFKFEGDVGINLGVEEASEIRRQLFTSSIVNATVALA